MEKNHHRRFMKKALDEAEKARRRDEVPIGAVVVHGDEIIGHGHNLRETRQDPTAHAEIIALREAAGNLDSWRLEDCHMYVTLEPCPMCAGALVQARVERLIYAAEDPKSGAVTSLYGLISDERLNHQIEVISGIFREKSRKLLQDFFAELRE